MDERLKTIRSEFKRVLRVANHKHPSPNIDVEGTTERLVLMVEDYANMKVSLAISKLRGKK